MTLFHGAAVARENVTTLLEHIEQTRQELEYHEREAETRRALLVEYEQALAASSRAAGNAGRRKRFYDPVRSAPPQLPSGRAPV